MDSVFLAWPSHDIGEETDEKLLGVYRSLEDAKAAVWRLLGRPGFRDYLYGLEIVEHHIGEDQWTEEFISWREAMSGPDESNRL